MLSAPRTGAAFDASRADALLTAHALAATDAFLVGRHACAVSACVVVLIVAQLVVGQPTLVQRRPLLVQPGLGTLARGLLLGDPRPLFGRLGLLLACLRVLPVLAHCSVAALRQLAFPTALLCFRPSLR